MVYQQSTADKVRAIYPEAYAESFLVEGCYSVTINDGNGNALSEDCETIDEAWNDAFLSLEQVQI